jgi:hypothetical protein
MPKIKPIIAGTPEDLADALGLPRAAAEEWQFQHVLLARLKEIAGGKTHAPGDRKASRDFANQDNLDSEQTILSMYRVT